MDRNWLVAMDRAEQCHHARVADTRAERAPWMEPEHAVTRIIRDGKATVAEIELGEGALDRDSLTPQLTLGRAVVRLLAGHRGSGKDLHEAPLRLGRPAPTGQRLTRRMEIAVVQKPH